MDEAVATAQALAIAVQLGAVISFLQERYLAQVHGRAALAANIAIALAIGIVATAQTGVTIEAPADIFALAVEVLRVAAVVAAASYATFRLITRPLAQRAPQ